MRQRPSRRTAGGCLLDPKAQPAGPLRFVALETPAAGLDAVAPLLEFFVIRGGELGVCAGECLAVAGPPGPPAQRRPQFLLGLVVAADPAGLSPGGTALVLVLPVHGVGGNRAAASPGPGLAKRALAKGRNRPLGRTSAGRGLRRHLAVGGGRRPRKQRLAKQCLVAIDHGRRGDQFAAF